MARLQELPPSAASLSTSLRDLGYSLETAVADIVDNSISAGATRVEVRCNLASDPPTLAVLDNGSGMDALELINALKHGGRTPRESRAESDLGRFGLGLKTASFSQCRQLTVVSSKGNATSAAQWDLDLVAGEDRWLVEVLDEDEIEQISRMAELPTIGTMVLWRKLDRLFEDELGDRRQEIVNEKLGLVRSHLSLVFHRFLSGEIGQRKLAILVNGHALTPFDPFCTSNQATQKLPRDVVKVNGQKVEIQAFILPHHSRLSAREYDFYRTRSDFISNQGAYVYRNGRLMAWGDWFRLVPKGEATKLGRVQIDFPNALDEAWTIDIKKSRARPPRIVRDHLKQILPKITTSAIRVQRGRGTKLYEETEEPVWERYADQGRVRYALNGSHPLTAALFQRLDEDGKTHLQALLTCIASSLPIDMLYSDYSSDPKSLVQEKATEADSKPLLRELQLLLFGSSKPDTAVLKRVAISTGLFQNCPAAVDRFIAEEIG